MHNLVSHGQTPDFSKGSGAGTATDYGKLGVDPADHKTATWPARKAVCDPRATRASAAEPRVLRNGELEILPAKRQARFRGAAIDFTALEFDLLLHFASHPGLVFSRAQLLDAVWGYTHDGYEHTVTTHINRLRAKLEADPMRPELILTVRGAGYKMRDAPP